MNFIEIHDVGYGECIVFEGKKNEILMVDCGSMNINIKNGDSSLKFKNYVTDFIVPRYKDAENRSFLLTHFHKDHMCGFKYIIKKDKNYFNKIYIPYPSINADGKALLLEIAIYAFVFLKRQTACASMSTSALFIFNFLSKNSGRASICPLKKGDSFEFSGIKYNVLNPNGDSFSFLEEFTSILARLDDILLSSKESSIANRFLNMKKTFCEEYVNCSNLCIKYNDLKNEYVKESIEKLNSYIINFNNLSFKLKQLDITSNIIEYLSSENINMQYSMAQNSASIVFHSDRSNMPTCNTIMMTGDATSEILDSLENELFESYNIIKVPHHGTDNYQSKAIDKINCSHMIISNGEYHAGGKISKCFSENTAIKHCTGVRTCNYFKANASCCNRMIFCDSLKKDGALSSHCDKKAKSTGVNKCGIYIVSPSGDRGCYCD